MRSFLYFDVGYLVANRSMGFIYLDALSAYRLDVQALFSAWVYGMQDDIFMHLVKMVGERGCITEMYVTSTSTTDTRFALYAACYLSNAAVTLMHAFICIRLSLAMLSLRS